MRYNDAMYTAEPNLGAIAALIAEPARTAIVTELFDGRALPAGELAKAAGVRPARASAHLARLVEGGLLELYSQGRHRYYRLASQSVAAALETLGALEPREPVRSLRESLRAGRLAFARSCYDHLAGELAIAVAEDLVARGALTCEGDGFLLHENADASFARLGVDVRAVAGSERYVKGCLDWTQRRPHIGGTLGRALLDALFRQRFVTRTDERRVVLLTGAGEVFFSDVIARFLTMERYSEAARANDGAT